MPRDCSIPARSFRSCIVAPSWAACTCMLVGWRSPTFRGSDGKTSTNGRLGGVMRFGLFCSPKADIPGFGPETGRGFFEFLDFNVEAETLGFHSSFSVEHHF